MRCLDSLLFTIDLFDILSFCSFFALFFIVLNENSSVQNMYFDEKRYYIFSAKFVPHFLNIYALICRKHENSHLYLHIYTKYMYK